MTAPRLIPGLCSVTFRTVSPARIVEWCARAGLEAIEWGGDAHVPPGRLDAAAEVRRLCDDAGVGISSYGSYYRAGADDPADFGAVLATAAELNAPMIRVWAFNRGSAQTTPGQRQAAIDDLRRIVRLAADSNTRIATEFHGGTLADDAQSARDLLDQTPNLLTYWQPPVGLPPDQALQGLRLVADRLAHLHVFHWIRQDDNIHRRPLADGADIWRRYLDAARAEPGHAALLEFVANDDPQQFLADAAALKRLVC